MLATKARKHETNRGSRAAFSRLSCASSHPFRGFVSSWRAGVGLRSSHGRRPMTFGRSWLAEWPLDPAVPYLNHGTVGVTPNRVRAVEREIRDAIEREPARFMLRELSARRSTARGSPADRVRGPRPTSWRPFSARAATTSCSSTTRRRASMPCCARSARARRRDPGQRPRLRRRCGTRRSRVRASAAPRCDGRRSRRRPVRAGTGRRVRRARSARSTRLAIVDHITVRERPGAARWRRSPQRCQARGVAVARRRRARARRDPARHPVARRRLVRRQPPQVGVGASQLRRSCGRRRNARQASTRTVISWGLDRGLTAEFDSVGTRDPTPHLAAPAALALLRRVGRRTAVQQLQPRAGLDAARTSRAIAGARPSTRRRT